MSLLWTEGCRIIEEKMMRVLVWLGSSELTVLNLEMSVNAQGED